MYTELEQAMRHPDVVKNIIKKGEREIPTPYSQANPPPYPVTEVAGKTGSVSLDKTDVGLDNVANVLQYSASNPPPYPVTSVNGQTGAASLAAADVGAVAESAYIADANTNPGWSGQPVLYRWNINTLNTPYTEGITSGFSYGIIICYSSYSSGICVQFAMCAGMMHVFCRRQNGGTWTAWSVVANKEDVPIVQSGTVAASVSSNAKVTTHVDFPTAYSTAPSVSVNYAGDVTVAVFAAMGYSVRNVTASGFDLIVSFNTSIGFSTASFRWQAIGS